MEREGLNPSIWPRRLSLTLGLASAYRALLGRVRFVGVTGSSGKTTTKELIGAVLGSHGPCRIGRTPTNDPHSVARTLFSVFPWHRYCVCELGGFRPGVLAVTTGFFRPEIGVVTRVAHDHYGEFRGLDATAREKATLVRALPATGAAILNADDPRVLAMRACTSARVITYGRSPEATVRGEEIACAWPEPLSLTVVNGHDRVRVQTQLLGEHWASAVLAALAAAVALGLPLREAAEAVSTVPPVRGRMSAHAMPDGVTFVQDTWKAALYTVPAALRFMQQARAPRKIAVIGTLADFPGSTSGKYRRVARQALEVADKVLFVGPWAGSALKGRAPGDADRLMGFADIVALRPALRDLLAPGDLVLLKGCAGTDHLERLVLDWTSEFACWRLNCGRLLYCADCRLRRRRFPSAAGAG